MSKRRGDVVFARRVHGRDRRRRGALVPRQPRARTRRSRSTSTSPRRRRRRTRSTTCSTRTRGSPASSATPRPSARLGTAPVGPLAAEERDLIKRLAEFPARRRRGDRAARAAGASDLRDPRRRRLPPLLPRASRARERAARVPPRALPRDAARDRALPRPDRSRGARADVKRLLLVARAAARRLRRRGARACDGATAAGDRETLRLGARETGGRSGSRRRTERGSTAPSWEAATRGVVFLHESPADLCGWEPYAARARRSAASTCCSSTCARYGLSRAARTAASAAPSRTCAAPSTS